MHKAVGTIAQATAFQNISLYTVNQMLCNMAESGSSLYNGFLCYFIIEQEGAFSFHLIYYSYFKIIPKLYFIFFQSETMFMQNQ